MSSVDIVHEARMVLSDAVGAWYDAGFSNPTREQELWLVQRIYEEADRLRKLLERPQ